MRALILAVLLVALLAGTCRAQLFAYVSAPEMDRQGKPIIDPASNKPLEDGFCLVWKPGWVLDNPALEILDAPFYTRLSYRADPDARQMTVYQLVAPSVLAVTSGAGWYPVGGETSFPVNIIAPMYPAPKSEWPCSQATWQAVLETPDRQYPGQQIVVPGAGGGFSLPDYRERQRQNACDNPQIPGNRQRCSAR
jgi:hypothetical protein